MLFEKSKQVQALAAHSNRTHATMLDWCSKINSLSSHINKTTSQGWSFIDNRAMLTYEEGAHSVIIKCGDARTGTGIPALCFCSASDGEIISIFAFTCRNRRNWVAYLLKKISRLIIPKQSQEEASLFIDRIVIIIYKATYFDQTF